MEQNQVLALGPLEEKWKQLPRSQLPNLADGRDCDCRASLVSCASRVTTVATAENVYEGNKRLTEL